MDKELEKLCSEISEYAVESDEYGEYLDYLAQAERHAFYFDDQFKPALIKQLQVELRHLKENYEVVIEQMKHFHTSTRARLKKREE